MFDNTDAEDARQTYIDCIFKELGVARTIVSMALSGRAIPTTLRDTYDELREESEKALDGMVQ